MSNLHDVANLLRRRFLRHRRLIVAGLAAVALVQIVQTLAPPAKPTSPVVVAAHDLEAGAVIGSHDVHVVRLDPDLVPAGASTTTEQVVGDTVAAPMRVGEALTDRRVVGPALIASYDEGLVATPVRIQDADVAMLLRAGDRIDVYAATGDVGATAQQVVSDATVVMIPRIEDKNTSNGALIVLALSPIDSARLAQASATTQLSVSLRG